MTELMSYPKTPPNIALQPTYFAALRKRLSASRWTFTS
jgi:hypothetical protein